MPARVLLQEASFRKPFGANGDLRDEHDENKQIALNLILILRWAILRNNITEFVSFGLAHLNSKVLQG